MKEISLINMSLITGGSDRATCMAAGLGGLMVGAGIGFHFGKSFGVLGAAIGTGVGIIGGTVAALWVADCL